MSDKYPIHTSQNQAALVDDEEQGGTGTGDIQPEGDVFFASYLSDETQIMENERRLLEQQGHSHYAKVNARDKSVSSELQNQQELGMQQGIKEHPFLQSQRFDGVDNNLNPAPPNNPSALWEYENERQKQEAEKELRLGYDPTKKRKFDPKPTP